MSTGHSLLSFVALACLWGAAYLLALVRGRLDWAARVRPMNLALAFVVCGVFVLLSPEALAREPDD